MTASAMTSACAARNSAAMRTAFLARVYALGARILAHAATARVLAMDSPPAAADNAPMDLADQRDIRASLKGDEDAYARLVRRYEKDVASRMWRFTRDRTDHEELTHEVFVEAYFSLPSFRGDAPFEHWLHVIATRVGYRFWRKQKRPQEATLPIEDWEAAAEDATEPQEAAELLHHLLAQLPPRDRLVLTLMYIEEHSVAETAGLTGWSESMVKVQAHRARKKLRAAFDRLERKDAGSTGG